MSNGEGEREARRGQLIVFEGGDGVGKTTQSLRLARRLTAAGTSVLALREPGGTTLGGEIRRLLLDPASEMEARAEALLFLASRAQLVERVIRPALANGAVVLLDRFFLSTYAYQAAGRGLELEPLRAVTAFATAGLIPDLTLLFSLPAAAALGRADARGTRDRMEQADDGFHARVARAFARFATADWQQAHPETGTIVALDASGSEADVAARVDAALVAHDPETFALARGSH